MSSRIEDCPLARTVEHLDGWWALEILHEIFDGHYRLGDIACRLQVSEERLAERMAAMVSKGLLARGAMADGPSDQAYELTEFGRASRPILITMAAWGNHRLPPARRGMVLVDVHTGQEADPVVVDRITGRRLDTEDFVFAAGHAASPAMRARYPGRRPAE